MTWAPRYKRSLVMRFLRPAALFLLLIICACSSSPPTAVLIPLPGNNGLPGTASSRDISYHPVGYFSYELPIVPITFDVSTDGDFSVKLEVGIATPLGDIRFAGGIAGTPVGASSGRPMRIQTVGVTDLIVCKAGSNRQACVAYAIRTGRKVDIKMDGQFEETIDNGVVTIDAAPGSIITVTDSGGQDTSGPRPAARIDIEHWTFAVNGPYTEVDIEQSQGGVQNDLAYDHVTGALYGINGAKVARIEHYHANENWLGHYSIPAMNLPSEYDCAQTPSSEWHTKFTADELNADVTVACIFTAQHDFGYLVIGRDPKARPITYYMYSYTWVRLHERLARAPPPVTGQAKRVFESHFSHVYRSAVGGLCRKSVSGAPASSCSGALRRYPSRPFGVLRASDPASHARSPRTWSVSVNGRARGRMAVPAGSLS